MKLTQNWLHCRDFRASWPRYTYLTRLQNKTQKHISRITSRKEANFPMLFIFQAMVKVKIDKFVLVCVRKLYNIINVLIQEEMQRLAVFV